MPPAADLPPIDPIAEISVSSQGMSQGLLQTDGPQIIPRLAFAIGSVRFGGQWRNIDSPLASGVAALFLKGSRRIGKVGLEVGAAYRIRTSVKQAASAKAWEFSASARRSVGRIDWRLAAEYSPDEFGNGQSLYVEAGPSISIDDATRASLVLGRRERAGAPDYTAANVSISRELVPNMTLEARYYQTCRSGLAAQYRSRIVLGVRLVL